MLFRSVSDFFLKFGSNWQFTLNLSHSFLRYWLCLGVGRSDELKNKIDKEKIRQKKEEKSYLAGI